MHCGASKIIFQYAELLRKNMMEAEKIVWEKLSNNKLNIRIRRQHPIHKYIADFYCHELKLTIEIDGDIHLANEHKEYDINRDITLSEFGIQILRFTNHQVINNIDEIMKEIKKKVVEFKVETIFISQIIFLKLISPL